MQGHQVPALPLRCYMNRGKEVTSPLQVSGSSSVKWDGKLPTSCQKDKWAKHLALSIEFSCSYSDDYSFYTFIWIQNLWEKINISTKGNEKGGFSSVYYSYFCVPKHCRREQGVNTSWEGGVKRRLSNLRIFICEKSPCGHCIPLNQPLSHSYGQWTFTLCSRRKTQGFPLGLRRSHAKDSPDL